MLNIKQTDFNALKFARINNYLKDTHKITYNES